MQKTIRSCKSCRHCNHHPALFIRRGRIRRDNNHDLCFRCYHSLHDSFRAARFL